MSRFSVTVLVSTFSSITFLACWSSLGRVGGSGADSRKSINTHTVVNNHDVSGVACGSGHHKVSHFVLNLVIQQLSGKMTRRLNSFLLGHTQILDRAEAVLGVAPPGDPEIEIHY
jgi:hypothetical protein